MKTTPLELSAISRISSKDKKHSYLRACILLREFHDWVNRIHPIGSSLDAKEVLKDIVWDRGDISFRMQGKWLTGHAGQIVDGLRFERPVSTAVAVHAGRS